ncbi:phosphatase PAP2 family protein [bacterium]|nr:phosphatase PAP2 family protein [bacterium]
MSLTEIDLALLRLANADLAAPILDLAARALQPAWPGIAAGAIVALVLARIDRRRAIAVALVAVAAVILADVVSSQILKPLIARPRPTAIYDDLRIVIGRKSGLGFPSNHAANMAAIATALAFYFRAAAIVVALFALIVGFTRVYAGVHYPSDVAGGFLVGIACAALVAVAARRWDLNRRIEALGFPAGRRAGSTRKDTLPPDGRC